MVTRIGSRETLRFLLTVALWVTGLFGVLRIPLVRDHVVLPLARVQGLVAAWGHGPGPLPVTVTLECSGTDVMALLVAVLLSYPSPWGRRLWGAAGGVGLLLAANIVRIASLAQIAGTAAFLPVHLYVWPAALVLITLAYTIAWMWTADAASGEASRAWLPFAAVASGLVCLFMAVLPVLLRLPMLAEASRSYAAAAASFLAALGLVARAEGSTLVTPQGGFLVTPECLVTPLMPLYLAAALTVPRTWRARLAMLGAFFPLFALLAWARLFTLALPATLVGSPIFAIHGFHQLLLGFGLVLAAALRVPRHGSGRAWRLGLATAVYLMALLGAASYDALLEKEASLVAILLPHTLQRLHQPGDAQGALVLLPPFQMGLLVALWLATTGAQRWRALVLSVSVLHLSQLLLLFLLGELAWYAALPGPVTLVRAWAFVVPLGLYALFARDRRTSPPAMPHAVMA